MNGSDLTSGEETVLRAVGSWASEEDRSNWLRREEVAALPQVDMTVGEISVAMRSLNARGLVDVLEVAEEEDPIGVTRLTLSGNAALVRVRDADRGRLLAYLYERTGGSPNRFVTRGTLPGALGLTESEADLAEDVLLQDGLVTGTMGGDAGRVWLTDRGLSAVEALLTHGASPTIAEPPPADTNGNAAVESATRILESIDAGRVRVFMSYSHDSAEHKAQVLMLANTLRDSGINAVIDQYFDSPEEGWPQWTSTQMSAANYVLVICTPTYYRRVTGSEGEGVGLGSRFEGLLISQEIFDAGGRNDKFIPVLTSPDHRDSIPEWLRPYTYYQIVDNDDGFESLYRRLTDRPRVVAPPIGEIIELPQFDPTEMGIRRPRLVSAPALPEWHVDVAFNWMRNGDSTRYAIQWAPGTGFIQLPENDTTLHGIVETHPPPDVDVQNSIPVTYSEGRVLRFDFLMPARKVTAKLHAGAVTHDPHSSGSGAEHHIEFRLGRIEGLG